MNLKLKRPHRRESEKKRSRSDLFWLLALGAVVVIALTAIISIPHRPPEEVAEGIKESARSRDAVIQKNLEEMNK